MYRNIFSLLILLNLCLGLHAQPSEMDEVLDAVRVNNNELKTLKAFIKSEELSIKTSNNLADPELIGYYLPAGIHPPGNYTEYQISQYFEFPTVYGARKKLISQQTSQLRVQFEKAQQEVLLDAAIYCQNLIYLNKRLQLDQERIQQAKSVFDLVSELYDAGDASLHELNQAKIGWLQNQFAFEKTSQSRNTALIALQQLNGGIAVTFNQENYSDPLELESFDSIWSEKVSEDPILKELEEEKLISLHSISVNKRESLPDLAIGYNYQGVPGLDYHGVFGGLTIPIWSNKNKVKAAKAQFESLKIHSNEKSPLYKSELKIKYSDFQFNLQKYRQYENTLEGLTHDLLESYKKAEITYIEYYMELHFYKQAFDTFLEIEHELYRLRSELIAHRL